MHHEREQGAGTGKPFQMAEFGERPCLGEAGQKWNSRIEYSSVQTAAPTSYLLRASRSFSTTNSLRTTPSTANSARRNVCGERRECAPRRAPPARSAARRLPSPSSRRRAARCCAGRAFRNRERRSLRRNLPHLPQRRTEQQVATEPGGEAGGADQSGKLRPMTLAVE